MAWTLVRPLTVLTGYSVQMPLKRRGPQWYMLSQLRDEISEGRLVNF